MTKDPVFVEFMRKRTLWYRLTLAIKRAADFLFALIGLTLLSPLFLTIAIAVWIDTDGPVFFQQKRLGIYGREFVIYKFRTMCQHAEEMETGLYSFAGDARITKIGNWLRSTSFDELPQLLNVLIGDMSLVGPRPAVTYELGDFATLNRRYKNRFRVKPGMTGAAQVAGRNCISWDQKVNLDNKYIDDLMHIGIWADLQIVVRTIGYMFQHLDVDVVEPKMDAAMNEAEAAAAAEREVIRIAHTPEDEA